MDFRLQTVAVVRLWGLLMLNFILHSEMNLRLWGEEVEGYDLSDVSGHQVNKWNWDGESQLSTR